MSKQIQIRRGSAAENDAFTGAVGEITMDTTNNTLRVHDGTTAGGIKLAKQNEIPAPYTMPSNYDFVVEYQEPTAANNYTWYRKYKSGWVEQGGTWTGNIVCAEGMEVYQTVNLPVNMLNTKYYASSSVIELHMLSMGITKNINQILFRFGAYKISRTLSEFTWYVCGKSA
ncbi:MAG: hypothetical protein IKN73_03210 [Alphaproteobacteria bacterium]|nr:hypothetical protein [Alphaproteobacteria bacterium]